MRTEHFFTVNPDSKFYADYSDYWTNRKVVDGKIKDFFKMAGIQTHGYSCTENQLWIAPTSADEKNFAVQLCIGNCGDGLAVYFLTDDFASCWRSCSTSPSSPGVSFTSAATAFLPRVSVSRPFSASHDFICCTELGLSSSVISRIAAESRARDRTSNSIARFTNGISTRMPRSFISSLKWYSSQTLSGTGNFASFCCICISTSTSRLL